MFKLYWRKFKINIMLTNLITLKLHLQWVWNNMSNKKLKKIPSWAFDPNFVLIPTCLRSFVIHEDHSLLSSQLPVVFSSIQTTCTPFSQHLFGEHHRSFGDEETGASQMSQNNLPQVERNKGQGWECSQDIISWADLVPFLPSRSSIFTWVPSLAGANLPS